MGLWDMFRKIWLLWLIANCSQICSLYVHRIDILNKHANGCTVISQLLVSQWSPDSPYQKAVKRINFIGKIKISYLEFISNRDLTSIQSY